MQMKKQLCVFLSSLLNLKWAHLGMNRIPLLWELAIDYQLFIHFCNLF